MADFFDKAYNLIFGTPDERKKKSDDEILKKAETSGTVDWKGHTYRRVKEGTILTEKDLLDPNTRDARVSTNGLPHVDLFHAERNVNIDLSKAEQKTRVYVGDAEFFSFETKIAPPSGIKITQKNGEVSIAEGSNITINQLSGDNKVNLDSGFYPNEVNGRIVKEISGVTVTQGDGNDRVRISPQTADGKFDGGKGDNTLVLPIDQFNSNHVKTRITGKFSGIFTGSVQGKLTGTVTQDAGPVKLNGSIEEFWKDSKVPMQFAPTNITNLADVKKTGWWEKKEVEVEDGQKILYPRGYEGEMHGTVTGIIKGDAEGVIEATNLKGVAEGKVEKIIIGDYKGYKFEFKDDGSVNVTNMQSGHTNNVKNYQNVEFTFTSPELLGYDWSDKPLAYKKSLEELKAMATAEPGKPLTLVFPTPKNMPVIEVDPKSVESLEQRDARQARDMKEIEAEQKREEKEKKADKNKSASSSPVHGSSEHLQSLAELAKEEASTSLASVDPVNQIRPLARNAVGKDC